jgi:hypothetical protein
MTRSGSKPLSRPRRRVAEITAARPPKAWHRSRRPLRAVITVPIAVALVSQRASLLSAANRLGRISPVWLALSLGAETVSFLAAAELQHHLLAGIGARVDRRSLIALSYAGTAMSSAIPAGAAVSGRYTYRALTRRGVAASDAAWVLGAAAVLSIATLALLGLVGAQLRGFAVVCSAAGGLVGGAVLFVAGAAVAALVWSSHHRGRLEHLACSLSARCSAARSIVARWLVARPETRRRKLANRKSTPQTPTAKRVPGVEFAGGPLGRPSRPAGTGTGGVRGLSDSAVANGMTGLGPARLSAAVGLAGANWLADMAALAVAFVALGVDVPWQGLLLAYAVTQVVTSVPLLPGSIGVAEGSMTAALVSSGAHPDAAVAGVLAYRLVSFWLVLPAGWLAWTSLKRREARPGEPIDRPFGRSSEPAAA